MSIETDLTTTPYFDDYSEDKDYYKILFQPSVPVQVRELNQLQTLLQKQIEHFGDNILKRGTIIDGCQFSFRPKVPFVKINDTTVSSFAVDVESYVGLFAKNADGKIATIESSVAGFESQNPNLNTLYLNYLNDGTSGDVASFAADQTLTIYNNDDRIEQIRIVNRSNSFSNTDSIVILSAIEVQNTIGGVIFSNTTSASVVFENGDTITQSSSLATATVVSVSTTANTQAVTLQIKPLVSELITANSASWDFTIDSDITVTGKSILDSRLSGFVGQNAKAALTTTSSGSIQSVTLSDKGAGYRVLPHVTVSTKTAPDSAINTLDLTPNNFLANVIVGNSGSSPIGFGYGVDVTEGVIYQKGYFLRTGPQSLIVSKYDPSPNNVSVGFVTQESITDASQDTSLVDNAAGFLNVNAPGADRLKLEPLFSSKTTEEAAEDTDYLALVSFSEGQTFSIMEGTQYNKLDDEMARRTYEESGNYVLDRFNLQTRSTLQVANTDTHFSYLIDPGHAYINGKRVQTIRNYSENVTKGTEETVLTDTSIDIYYGNYIRVKEFAGFHNFTTGGQIDLHTVAKQYLSTSINGAIAAAGVKIGSARVRSIIHENGIEGTPEAIYRVYLFDVKMLAGKNFRDTKSIFVTGAIGDLILESTSGAGGATPGAVLKESNRNSLIFNTEYPLKSVANVEYQYRTTATNIVVSTAGGFTLAAETGAAWPYTGALSFVEEREVIITPKEDFIDTTSLGTYGSADSAGLLTATGSTFLSTLSAGDYIRINATKVLVKEVLSDTTLKYLPAAAITTGAIVRCYPTGVPIPLSGRSTATATVTGTNLVVDMDIGLGATANVSVVFNQRTAGTASNSVAKTAKRNRFVKIDTGTHGELGVGPWCLGHSDIFRMRNVYIGSSTAVAITDTNVTDEFFVDANHTENYYGLGSLHFKSESNLDLANKYILVEFDYSEHPASGVKTVSSYTVEDGVLLSGLTANVNTLEIPEFIGVTGDYHDLREAIDFRPVTANTNLASADSTTAPVNPDKADVATRFSGTIKFPAPESDMLCTMTYYNSRKDVISAQDDQSRPYSIQLDSKRPEQKVASELSLYEIDVPAYPSLPEVLSADVLDILDTKLGGTSISLRSDLYTIEVSSIDSQAPGYTMEEIGKLERRIATLEYYVNLSETEGEIKDKTIPSSVDSTLERFKFGFFVDDFSDDSFTNIESLEQNSTFFSGLLAPSSESYNVVLGLSEDTKSKYVSFFEAKGEFTRKSIVSQPNATDGPVIPAEPPIPAVTVCNTSVFICNKNIIYNGARGLAGEDNDFLLSSSPDAAFATIRIEFDLYGGRDHIAIFQGHTPTGAFVPVTTSSLTLPTIISADRKRVLQNKDFKRLLKYNNKEITNRWAFNPNFTRTSGVNSVGGTDTTFWMQHIGQMEFNYNMTRGRYLKVRIIKGSPHHSYFITYPRDCSDSIHIPPGYGEYDWTPGRETFTRTILPTGAMTEFVKPKPKPPRPPRIRRPVTCKPPVRQPVVIKKPYYGNVITVSPSRPPGYIKRSPTPIVKKPKIATSLMRIQLDYHARRRKMAAAIKYAAAVKAALRKRALRSKWNAVRKNIR